MYIISVSMYIISVLFLLAYGYIVCLASYDFKAKFIILYNYVYFHLSLLNH